MIQNNSSSFFNAYNQAKFLVEYQGNLLWFFYTGNALIFLPVCSELNATIKDEFNNHQSFYRFSKKINLHLKQNNFLFFEKLFLLYWKRIIFRGKSFRVRVLKRNKKLVLNFGYSHWTRLLFFKPWNFFKKRRQSYVVYSNDYRCFIDFICFFPWIKPYNRYTLRGLRFKQQALGRRFGKVSQHTSIF